MDKKLRNGDSIYKYVPFHINDSFFSFFFSFLLPISTVIVFTTIKNAFPLIYVTGFHLGGLSRK